jgi:glycosyltransferase involved in cell wall biosynthesis
VRFSILLPTRNRADLLGLAVQSVLDQDFGDWEIVVSDNASDDGTFEVIARFGDPRIKYVRGDTLVPVTENWNLALENSTGDYVIMLGDDDCLMSGCLSTADALLQSRDEPELLFTAAVQYAYPGVLPDIDDGQPFVQFFNGEFMRGAREVFWLPKAEALRMVELSVAFQVAYPYNMQHSIVSRRIIERMENRGPFFQSPYPDYYATNALFLTAERILVSPWPLIAIGISPKSFGFFYFNQREGEGVDFLKNIPDQRLVERAASVIMPGTNMNTSWLLAMEALEMNFGSDYPIHVVGWRYRFLQFRSLFTSLRPIRRFVVVVWESGRFGEKLFWMAFLGLAAFVRLFGSKAKERVVTRLLDGIHTSHPTTDLWGHRGVPYQNILELERAEDPKSLVPVEA